MKSDSNPDVLPPLAVVPRPTTTTTEVQEKWNTKKLGVRLASDFVAAASAASLIAPIITIIDRGIMENASGKETLANSIRASFKTLVTHPQALLFSKPLGLIFMLYGGTYLTANTLDTATSTVQNKPVTLVTSDTLKFAASSGANIGLCLFKDQAFARLFGPGGPPRPVPPPAYLLFSVRDCLTIFASFNVPPLLAPMLGEKLPEEFQKKISGQTLAQFLAPAGMQLVSTPMHLLGLDLYNRSNATVAERWSIVKKNWGVSSFARMCRIMPAFGVGGVVNGKVRKNLLERFA